MRFNFGFIKKMFSPGASATSQEPGLTEHNLEYADRPEHIDTEQAPRRDQRDADFGAEAHGFTGFEKAGKGSTYSGEDA